MVNAYSYFFVIQYKILSRVSGHWMQDQSSQKYLIRLKDSAEQQKYELIKQKLSKHAKYFYDIRSRTLIIYDHTLIYLISNEETRVTDLGKQHSIVQIIYNPIKNMLIFCNHDGHLFAHFINHKSQFIIKKDLKKQSTFGWIYNKQTMDLFIAQSSSIKLYKIQQQKKTIKQQKSLSGKYNSFLYQPNTQVLICFPVGDCKTIQTYMFDDESKYKNWYKGPQIFINIECDQNLKILAKKNKSLGLHSSHLNYQLFCKMQADQFAAEVIKLNNRCYVVFYFGSQGKLKLYSISQQAQKQIQIKLPSDCLPAFNVVDNMLVIHMNNQKITFIYDINNSNAQMLVSPFPVQHCSRKMNPYQGIFRNNRHIMPDGTISKWVINISVIYYYLKNQLQIFDFLIKREKGKADLLKWLRENLMKIKQINLSKFWKLIFIKFLAQKQYEANINVSLTDIYANIFYTLSCDELTPKQPLVSIILQCLRQAKQMQIKIPHELQKLTFQLLIQCKKYEILVFLCHNDIIKDNPEFVENLMRKSVKYNEQILLTLAIDMANRVCKQQKVFEMLMVSQNIWQARRYLKQNYENIEVQFMIHCAKVIKDQALKQEYLRLTRSFIVRKFPSFSQKYINQAQQAIRQKKNTQPQLKNTLSETQEKVVQPLQQQQPQKQDLYDIVTNQTKQIEELLPQAP